MDRNSSESGRESIVDSFSCNLHDLFVLNGKGDNPKFELMNEVGYPMPLLFKLMRDIVTEVAELHHKGIVHGNLNPQNVFIYRGTSLCVKIIEETTAGYQTYADDLFAIGCLLFFCISGGRYLLCISCGNQPCVDRNILYSSHISKSILHLYQEYLFPEAEDLIPKLLDRFPDKRPRAVEVLRHPLLWDAKLRLEFLLDMNFILDKVAGDTSTTIFKSFASVARDALGPEFVDMNDPFSQILFHIKDIHRGCKDNITYGFPAHHCEIFEEEFRLCMPRLLMETYKVVSKHVMQLDENFVCKYLSIEKVNSNGNHDEKAVMLPIYDENMEEVIRKSREHEQNGINSEFEAKPYGINADDWGSEYDSDPGECNLLEHFVQMWKGNLARSQFLDENGYPTPWLLNLMRGFVSEVAQFHYNGIVHGNLKPHNVLICHGSYIFVETSKETTTGFVNLGCETYADDLFALGCLIFFCVSGGKNLLCEYCGKYPFGEDDIVCNSHISNSILHLSRVNLIPEADDLISRLLDPLPEKRPRAVDVIHHPLFWDAKKRLEFFYDVSSIVDKAAGKTRIALYKSLKSVIRDDLSERQYDMYDSFYRTKTKSEDDYLNDSSATGHILRKIQYKYERYLSIWMLVFPDTFGDIEECFRLIYPRQLIEVYKVMSKHANELDEIFVGNYSVGWIYSVGSADSQDFNRTKNLTKQDGVMTHHDLIMPSHLVEMLEEEKSFNLLIEDLSKMDKVIMF